MKLVFQRDFYYGDYYQSSLSRARLHIISDGVLLPPYQCLGCRFGYL